MQNDSKQWLRAALAAMCIVSVASADEMVNEDSVLVLDSDDADVGPGTFTVTGQLTVNFETVQTFAPTQLVLNGDGTLQSQPGTTARNGHAFLNGTGAYNIGSLSVGSESALFVNAAVQTGSADNAGLVRIVTGSAFSPGTFSSSGALSIATGGTLVTSTFFSSSPALAATINGGGKIQAEAINFDNSQLLNLSTNEAETLTIDSDTAVELVDTILDIDIYPGATLTNDALAFTGDVTPGGFLSAKFSGFTSAELIAHGRFTILTANAVDPNGMFIPVDPEGEFDIYDGGEEIVGQMVLGQDSTSVYFDYVAVPEPTAFLAVALAGGATLLRRRRAR